MAGYARGVFQVTNDRIPRAARMTGRALNGLWAGHLVTQLLSQRDDQSGLADPRLAGNQQELSVAALRLAKVIAQEAQLRLAGNQRREARGLTRLESADDRARSQDPPHNDVLVDPADAMGAEILEVEQPAEEAAGAR